MNDLLGLACRLYLIIRSRSLSPTFPSRRVVVSKSSNSTQLICILCSDIKQPTSNSLGYSNGVTINADICDLRTIRRRSTRQLVAAELPKLHAIKHARTLNE